MIRIRARLGNGHTSIEVDGHEGHAVDGRVCAAVTAITQTALLGLEQYALQYPDLVSVEITQE
ncbi:ribosomal-processing cysteine protease Prp [Streptomyces sp. NPDC002758]